MTRTLRRDVNEEHPVQARQNAVGALFAEDDAAAGAIDDLVGAGVRPASIAVAAHSAERARRLAAHYRIAMIPVDGGVDGFARTLFECGIDSDRATHFSTALGESVLLIVSGADVTAERVGLLTNVCADLGLANVGGIDLVIPLRAEQIIVDKSVVVTNEVTVRTEVITEVKTFEVQLQREEFVIERTSIGPEGSEAHTMRIPLRHEEALITKRTIITEEVNVRTEQFVDVELIEENVRHEVLHVAQHDQLDA